VNISDEEKDFLTVNFNKVASLNNLMRESLNSVNPQMSAKFDEFQKTLEETQSKLAKFIRDCRTKHDFPVGIDCNAEYYHLKLKQDPNCKN
jgi:hypothetical protein